MILSLCLASFLPFLAYSFHHYEVQHPHLVSPEVDFMPQLLPPPPPPPHSSYYSSSASSHHRRMLPKLPNIWKLDEKDKRTATFTAAPALCTTVNQAPTITEEYQQQISMIDRTRDIYFGVCVNVTSGARITWYKDNVPLVRQGDSSSSSSSIATNLVSGSNTPLGISSCPSSSLVVSSGIYIDCVDNDDAGQYRLEVENPGNSQVLRRNYTLIVVDWWTSAGSTCQVGESVMAYVPRIYQYPLYVMGNENESIILPCRYQGLLSSREWRHNNTVILPQDTNHEMLPNGDLLIRRLGADPVEYKCQVSSTRYPIEADIVAVPTFAQQNSAVNSLP